MNNFEIYTDGATSKNGYEDAYGAYAWIIVKNGEIIKSNSVYMENTTNNKCELMGIIESCQNFINLYPNENVTIYSDSAYCINCYLQGWYKNWQNNGWINSKKQSVANKELWEKLIPFFENINFSFKKVKGHNINIYNNLVDKMAVNAKFAKEIK